MTKRPFNSNEINSKNKKPKLYDDIEELWGDELDESVFDDCIKLTQALQAEEEKGNESVLPSYDVFKIPQPMFCSTQLDNNIKPTTSMNRDFRTDKSKNEVEIDCKKLKLQCEEKDGEIAILRNQLKELKTQSSADFIKAQSEWNTKLNLSEKQVQSIKSELEFKNLEIINLKQKVLNVTKQSMNMTINNDAGRSPKPSTSKEITVEQNSIPRKFYVTSNTDYPLKSVFNDTAFTLPSTEKFIIENKLTHTFKNAIPYLQNKTVSTTVIVDKNRSDLQSVFPIILRLCECTSEEINSSKCMTQINKIVCIGLQSLEDLLELLEDIKKNMRTEDLLEADSLYIKNVEPSIDSTSNLKNDLGLKSAFILDFLSVLLPYSSYLKGYIFNNNHLDLEKDKQFIKELPYLGTKQMHTGQDLLNKLVNILKLIGEIRKANVTATFLKSVIKLFTSICKLKGYTNLSEVVCTVTKELILLRPWRSVTFELTYLLREASRHTSFVQFLLNKSKKCCSVKKGVLYFTEDSCRFYVFVLIFDRCLSKKKSIPLEISLNMMLFIYNTYKSSYFLHHQDIKECECLAQLYKLEIELIFRMLEKYTEEVTMGNRISHWDDFFNNSIVLKVLNLMAFHCYELTEKYIKVYSQFKEIERRLNEYGVCDLDRLNINEDLPEIDSRNFENIDF